MIDRLALIRRHLRIGWWTLLLWLVVGIALETMHGLKLAWYLNVGNEARRLLFTLAHAHGTLLALVHVAFACTLSLAGPIPADAAVPRGTKLASTSLFAASILLPAGFLLGGVVIYGGSDPGPGIFLVPLGALALLIGVFAVALAQRPAR